MNTKSDKNQKIFKSTLVVATGVIILIFLAGPSLLKGKFIRNGDYTNDIEGFRAALKDHYNHADGSEASLRYAYENFLSPDSKKLSEDEWVNKQISTAADKSITFQKIELNEAVIDGNEGFADRTVYACGDGDCNKIIRKSRGFRRYVYDSGKWLMSNERVLCPRKTGYQLSPEFSRTLSLIDQRFSSQKNNYKDFLIV